MFPVTCRKIIRVGRSEIIIILLKKIYYHKNDENGQKSRVGRSNIFIILFPIR